MLQRPVVNSSQKEKFKNFVESLQDQLNDSIRKIMNKLNAEINKGEIANPITIKSYTDDIFESLNSGVYVDKNLYIEIKTIINRCLSINSLKNDQDLKEYRKQMKQFENIDKDKEIVFNRKNFTECSELITLLGENEKKIADQEKLTTYQKNQLADQKNQLADQKNQIADQEEQLACQEEQLVGQKKVIESQNEQLKTKDKQSEKDNTKIKQITEYYTKYQAANEEYYKNIQNENKLLAKKIEEQKTGKIEQFQEEKPKKPKEKKSGNLLPAAAGIAAGVTTFLVSFMALATGLTVAILAASLSLFILSSIVKIASSRHVNNNNILAQQKYKKDAEQYKQKHIDYIKGLENFYEKNQNIHGEIKELVDKITPPKAPDIKLKTTEEEKKKEEEEKKKEEEEKKKEEEEKKNNAAGFKRNAKSLPLPPLNLQSLFGPMMMKGGGGGGQ